MKKKRREEERKEERREQGKERRKKGKRVEERREGVKEKENYILLRNKYFFNQCKRKQQSKVYTQTWIKKKKLDTLKQEKMKQERTK